MKEEGNDLKTVHYFSIKHSEITGHYTTFKF